MSLCTLGYNWFLRLQVRPAASHLIFHLTVSPSPPVQGCCQSSHPPFCMDIGYCLNPGAGPCTWSCWISWGSHGPTPQACQDPPRFPLMNQLHPWVIHKLAESALNPTAYVINEDTAPGPLYRPWEDTTCYWSSFGHWAVTANTK